MIRTVIAELWTGAVVVRRLGPDEPNPTVAELDAIATTMTPRNDGVRPVVRVLERSGIPGGGLGVAGSVW